MLWCLRGFFEMRMKMMCRLAGMVAAAALLAAAPLSAQSSRPKAKAHAKSATTHKTTTHKKAVAKKSPMAKDAAKPVAEPAPKMSRETVDSIHAWEAQRHGTAGSGEKAAAEKSGGRTGRGRSTGRAPERMGTPASDRTAERPAAEEQTSGREATSADFDKAAEAKARGKRGAAKPDPDVPVEPAGTTPKSEVRTAEPKVETKSSAPVKVKLTYVHGRLVVPAPMYGSHEVLVHQNVVADKEGLTRIQDSAELETMRSQRLLVALPAGRGLRVDPRLASDRRYTRPWTAKFLSDLARAHAAKFGGALQVNSAVRTVDFQTRLAGYNGNAAGVEGDTASPHLTGEAVDVAKHGLSRTEIAWMRAYLAPLMAAGKIDVEEEFQQACFHISVYRRYVPEPVAAPRRMMTASEKRPGRVRHPAAAVAAAIQ